MNAKALAVRPKASVEAKAATKAAKALKGQTEAESEERLYDRLERLAIAAMSAPIIPVLVAGVGGVLAHEPTITSLGTVTATGQVEGTQRFRRWVFTYKVANLYTHILRFPGISLPDPFRGGTVQIIPPAAWPDQWTIGLTYPDGALGERAYPDAEKKLLTALRAYGFAAGSAFGLGMAAIGGFVGRGPPKP